MALAVNGSGTIFNKCDRSNHRPGSNKGCASSTCQHTWLGAACLNARGPGPVR
jgi:hypothetical protein